MASHFRENEDLTWLLHMLKQEWKSCLQFRTPEEQESWRVEVVILNDTNPARVQAYERYNYKGDQPCSYAIDSFGCSLPLLAGWAKTESAEELGKFLTEKVKQ